MVFVMGGCNEDGEGRMLSSMERHDGSSDQWSTAAAMNAARSHFGACAVAGDIYVTGGTDEHDS
jgi:N-acetylneuraminic acid mutarotase